MRENMVATSIAPKRHAELTGNGLKLLNPPVARLLRMVSSSLVAAFTVL
jgi:hypothetical protein